MEEGETLNKIGKGAFVFILGVIFSKSFGLFYKVLVARTGPYNYGVLSLGIGIFGFFAILATMGFDIGVTKYVAFYKNKLDEAKIKGAITSALKIAFITSLLLSILGFLLADLIAIKLFHNQDVSIVIRILMMVIPFEAMRKIFIAITKAFQHVKYEMYSKDIVENIVKLTFTIVAIVIGAGFIGLSIAFALGIVASFLTVAYFVEKRVFPIFRTKVVSVKPYAELFNYSWPLMFTSLLFILSLWMDSFLIGYFKDVSTVGLFNAAGPIAFLIYQLPLSLMTIFLPIITDLKAKEDFQGLESIYKTITRWIFVTGLMVVSIIIIFSRDIIGIIFGANYLLATIPLIILAVGYFINSIIFTCQRVFMAFDRTKLIFIDTILLFSMNISLAIYFIPSHGMVGAAISTASAFALLSIITLFQVKLTTKLKTFDLMYIRQAVPVLLVAGLVYLIRDYLHGYLFIIGALIVPLLSLAIIYATRGFSEREIEMVKSVTSKLKKY